MAEVLKTIFSNDIQKNIFPENAFYKNSKLDVAGADAKTVEVPQSGSTPTVTIDATSFPLAVSQRTDSKKSYTLKLANTAPIHIEDINEIQLSYSKRMDVLQDHIDTLNTRIADEINYAWSPSTNIIETSGSAVSTALAPGATSTRKAVALADFIKVFNMFNNHNIPFDGRKAIFPADLYGQLLAISEFISYDKMNSGKIPTGVIGTLMGFEIMIRSNTTVYTNANAPKAVGASTATTDNLAALFWHPQFVRRAEAPVKVYSEIDSPLYLGSIFNASVRFGGMISRTDEKGVVALVQDN